MEKLIAFDIETTGLYPEQGDRIVEIGAIPIIGSEVVLEKGFEAFINPGIPIPADITAINGITDDMVKEAPPLESVLPVFLHFISDKPLIAHNAAFDVGFITYYLRKAGVPVLKNPIIDTLELSRKAFPHAHTHTLDAVLQRLKITYSSKNRHRSLGDAYLTAQAYLKLKKLC